MLEFSKKLTVALTVFFFLEMIYVAILVKSSPDSMVLSTVTTEINETFRVCVGGYFCKAGIENAIKIYHGRKKSHETAKDEETSTEG